MQSKKYPEKTMHPVSTMKAGLITAFVAGSLIASAQAQVPVQSGPPPAAAPAGQPPARAPMDPRVQQRTYTFPGTNEVLPYAVFVSSKVSKDKKNPLIVALHGLGGDQNTMMRANALQLAEEGGYIMVSPMGYNSSGWYGAPSTMASGAGGAAGGAGMGGPRGGGPGAGAPRGGGAPGAGPGAGAGPGPGPGAGPARGAMPPGAAPGAGPGAGAGGARGALPTTLGTPNETSQKSEKDVWNVLEMIRKEFNVDENRTYLMGHSMGGAGAIYLGAKYPSIWAAVGAEAPATQPAGINPLNYSLAPARNVPMIIVQGDMDTLVPHLTSTRPWVEHMKELGMTHQYVEVAGGDHGSVLTTGAADIFAFFAKHSKAPR
jgi:poly(3-hydroxybutyrate) depolymerase